jgi:hypothetical protein
VNVNTTIRALIAAMRAYRTIPTAVSGKLAEQCSSSATGSPRIAVAY